MLAICNEIIKTANGDYAVLYWKKDIDQKKLSPHYSSPTLFFSLAPVAFLLFSCLVLMFLGKFWFSFFFFLLFVNLNNLYLSFNLNYYGLYSYCYSFVVCCVCYVNSPIICSKEFQIVNYDGVF